MNEQEQEEYIEICCTWVRDVVARARFLEPAFAVCLSYGPSTQLERPTIGVLLDRERRSGPVARHTLRLSSDSGGDVKLCGSGQARWAWYNVANFRYVDTPRTGAIEPHPFLDAAAELHEDPDGWSDLYARVAERLARLSWDGILPTTDDFLVYAACIEDWQGSFARSVPASLRLRLYRDGFLPAAGVAAESVQPLSVEEATSRFEEWTLQCLPDLDIPQRPKAAFLCLAYDGFTFEPTVVLGLDQNIRGGEIARRARQRQEQVTKGTRQAALANLFNPGYHADVRGATLSGRYFSAAHPSVALLVDGPAIRNALVDLTVRLAARDLSKLWPVTEDFAVFATDLSMLDWEANFRTSVPIAVRSRLAQAGLIPASLGQSEA